MKSGTPSPLGAMVRLVARGIQARRAPPSADPVGPRRKVACERSCIPVDPSRVRAYLRATAGGGVGAFAGEDAVVPPFFPATWETGLALQMFAEMDRPLPLGAIVHASTEMVWTRPLRPGDVVRARMELDRVEPARGGMRMTVLGRTWLGAGQLCCQSTSVFQVRTRSPRADRTPATPRADRREGTAPATGWAELVRWELSGSAGRRYARASGDYNPIHLWAATARPFGFRAPILHGYAIVARAAHTLIEHRLQGDPSALRRMTIAFRAPLPLPATACFLVNDDGETRWFRVAAPGEGPVYAEGTYGASDPRNG